LYELFFIFVTKRFVLKKWETNIIVFVIQSLIFMVQFNTIEEILEAADEHHIDFVKFQFSDTGGAFKELDVPLSLLGIALSKGVPFENSIVSSFKTVSVDLILKPDIRTFSIISDGIGSVSFGRIICELMHSDGQTFDGCARNALKLFVRKIFQAGYIFSVSASISFYLFSAETRKKALSPQNFTEQRDFTEPMDAETVAKMEKFKRDVLQFLMSADIEISSMFKNDQNGPFTVVLKESSVLRIADNIMTLKYIIQNAAQRYGLYASFMPKPLISTEGLTTSFGFVLMKNEFNEFYHPGKDMMISEKAHRFIGGIFSHIRGICAVTNPTVNSYKRIAHKGKAPYYISWSDADRYSLIRLPSSRGRLTKIEIQNADSTCNPYLSLLVLLSSGIAGIENSTEVVYASNLESGNLSDDEKAALSAGTLPTTLSEAIEEFKKDDFLKHILGENISASLVQTLAKEWEDYSKHVHLWELEKYL